MKTFVIESGTLLRRKGAHGDVVRVIVNRDGRLWVNAVEVIFDHAAGWSINKNGKPFCITACDEWEEARFEAA